MIDNEVFRDTQSGIREINPVFVRDFENMDSNEDGFLRFFEIDAHLKKLGIGKNESTINLMIEHVDNDDNQLID